MADRTPLKQKNAAILRFAFFLNLGFTLLEIIGGILTNSLAIVSDAVHDLGDSLSLGLAWYFEDIIQIRNRARSLLEKMDFEHTTVKIGYEKEYCRMKE